MDLAFVGGSILGGLALVLLTEQSRGTGWVLIGMGIILFFISRKN